LGDATNGLDALILGMLRDKNSEAFCNILGPLACAIYLTPVESERTVAPELLGQYCSAANPSAQVVICTSLEDAIEHAQDARWLLITGSLFLVGQALELLQVGAAPTVPERQLNDWTALPRIRS